jgi:hypothetical protein
LLPIVAKALPKVAFLILIFYEDYASGFFLLKMYKIILHYKTCNFLLHKISILFFIFNHFSPHMFFKIDMILERGGSRDGGTTFDL